MTRDESKDAILAEWHRLPTWKRRSGSDVAEFTQIMLTSRPDLTAFECPFDHYLVIRSWLVAEQRAAEAAGSKRRTPVRSKAPVVPVPVN